MKQLSNSTIALLSLMLLAPSLSAAEPLVSAILQVGQSSQIETSLTIYSDNFALVSEVRQAQLPEGRFELNYGDVAASIDPTSVAVSSKGEFGDFTVLEQSYRYDLLNRESLLKRFINHKLKYARSVSA